MTCPWKCVIKGTLSCHKIQEEVSSFRWHFYMQDYLKYETIQNDNSNPTGDAL